MSERPHDARGLRLYGRGGARIVDGVRVWLVELIERARRRGAICRCVREPRQLRWRRQLRFRLALACVRSCLLLMSRRLRLRRRLRRLRARARRRRLERNARLRRFAPALERRHEQRHARTHDVRDGPLGPLRLRAHMQQRAARARRQRRRRQRRAPSPRPRRPERQPPRRRRPGDHERDRPTRKVARVRVPIGTAATPHKVSSRTSTVRRPPLPRRRSPRGSTTSNPPRVAPHQRARRPDRARTASAVAPQVALLDGGAVEDRRHLHRRRAALEKWPRSQQRTHVPIDTGACAKFHATNERRSGALDW